MNCTPNCLARYIGKDPSCIGWIVRCVRIHVMGSVIVGTPVWVTEPSLPNGSGDGTVIATADYLLKPINNPGEDETDEMVLKVGIPEGIAA